MIPINYLTDVTLAIEDTDEDEEADEDDEDDEGDEEDEDDDNEDDEDSKIYLSERVVKLAEYHIRSL